MSEFTEHNWRYEKPRGVNVGISPGFEVTQKRKYSYEIQDTQKCTRCGVTRRRAMFAGVRKWPEVPPCKPKKVKVSS